MHPSDAAGKNAGLDFRDKILSPERLAKTIRAVRSNEANGRTPIIVQCHGCFDIVHPGHVRYLQFAKSQGDLLVVSITGDAQIHKGVQRPYIPEELRAENLAALAFVDYVVIDPRPTAVELLDLLRPDVYVKGREYATSDDPRFLAERDTVESHGGRVVFSSGEVVFSSSRLVESISNDADLQNERLAVVCRRNKINRPAISGLLQRAGGRRVVVVGDTLIDRYVLCDSGAMSTESPMMSLRKLDERDFLGGAAFIAAQLAEFGARPILVTRRGAGPLAEWAQTELSKAGVEVLGVPGTTDAPLRTRFLVDEQKVMKVTAAASSGLDPLGERSACELVAAALHNSDAILLHDSGHGFLSPGLLRAIQNDLAPNRPYTSAAWGETPLNPASLTQADLICCSERRLRHAMNDRDSGLSSLAYRLLDSTQARRLIVTLGKSGLVTFDRPSQDPATPAWRGRLLSEYLPTFATRLVDRLGAGDALFSAATLASAMDGSLMQSAYVGALAAALAVDRIGPWPVGIDELRKVIANRAELHAPPTQNRTQRETASPTEGLFHAAHGL